MQRGLTLGVAACSGLAAALASGLVIGLLVAGCSSSNAVVDDPGDAADSAVTPDAANAVDSSTDAPSLDAPVEAFTPPQPFCALVVPKPKFCDDFDDGDLTNDWDQPTVLPGSSIDLDDTTFTSKPFSFIAQAGAVGAASSGNASLRKTVLGAVNHGTLSFSALFSAVTFTEGTISIASFDVASDHYFTLNLRDQDMTAPAASLEEFTPGAYKRHLLTKLPPAGAWTRVTVDLDFVAGKANVSFGAVKALVDEPITPLPGTEATIRLGAVYFVGPAEAFTVNVDDVVVQF